MKIHVYAGLKEFFSSEFELPDDMYDIDQLRACLLGMNSQAAKLLAACRFAVEEGFIDNTYKFKAHETVIVVPPSSGG
jgi:molybdopterin synthase sulfur carrier subunit